MKELINPYANALDGLEINNPVTAFFNFCKEREQIRLKRESGTAFPWTDDQIFQKGRFLNVFREDDRGSKAILKFANNLDEDFSKITANSLLDKSPVFTFSKLTIASETKAVSLSSEATFLASTKIFKMLSTAWLTLDLFGRLAA